MSRARRISENAFGILAARWRIYHEKIIGKLENVDNIVKATVSLHNFIIKEHLNASYLTPRLFDSEQNDGTTILATRSKEPTHLRPIGRVSTNTYRKNAKNVRDEYCRYFNEEGAVPWQWDHV